MSESVKETKEVVIGLMTLGALVGAELKDGFQVQDLTNIFAKMLADPEKKAKLEAAIADIQKVPAELKDLSLPEGVELAIAFAQELPKLLEALKKSA